MASCWPDVQGACCCCAAAGASCCAGSERGAAKWREADLEWLGSKPSQVQTSVFEMGQEQPHAQEHELPGVSVPLQHQQQPASAVFCQLRETSDCLQLHLVMLSSQSLTAAGWVSACHMHGAPETSPPCTWLQLAYD
jgi:hypothetical protein